MAVKTREQLEAAFSDAAVSQKRGGGFHSVPDNGDLKDLLDSLTLTEELPEGGGALPEPLVAGAVEAMDSLRVGDGTSGELDIPLTAQLTPQDLGFVSESATELEPTKSLGEIIFGASIWADDEAQQADVALKANWFDAVTQRFVIALPGGSLNILADFPGNDGVIVYAYGLVLRPLNDDTGSLGAAGKTFGDIFATLPTVDPEVVGQFWSDPAADFAVKVSQGA